MPASYLGVPISTVYDWRTRGLGPRAYRFGKHLKFAVSDVQIWIEQQRELEPPEATGHLKLAGILRAGRNSGLASFCAFRCLRHCLASQHAERDRLDDG